VVEAGTDYDVAGNSASIEELYPLLAGQRWLLQLLKESPAMARPVQRIYRLPSSLDTAAFLAAFRHVVSIHPALRTRLVETDEGWRQCFPAFEAEISGVAVEGRSQEERVAYAWSVFTNDSAPSLDLRSAPPFIARMIRLDGEYYFGLCLDHIAADEIATGILEREISKAYFLECEDQPHPASSATYNFFAYVAREAQQRIKEAGNLDYWRKQLLGTRLVHHQSQDHRWVPGATHHWKIGGEAFEAMKRACRSFNTSISSAVLAAYVKLLTDVCGTEDLVVNVPVSNRTLAAHYELIANLSMLLHIRFRLKPTPCDSRFLVQVRDQLLEAMVHRQYDYEALTEIISADAASRGGQIHWVTGCSFIVERNKDSDANCLFNDRLDNQPDVTFDIPEDAFALTCRQKTSELCLSAEWDGTHWPLTGSEIENQIRENIACSVETPALT
jgi:hypothetical protein